MDAREALERRIDELCAENERLRLRHRGYVVDLQEALAENAKLREELEQWRRLTAGIELPEYPITEFKPKDLERENAKLRELAERAWKTAERLCQAFDGPCRDDGVTIDKPCPMGERYEECVYGQLQRELRELGIIKEA